MSQRVPRAFFAAAAADGAGLASGDGLMRGSGTRPGCGSAGGGSDTRAAGSAGLLLRPPKTRDQSEPDDSL